FARVAAHEQVTLANPVLEFSTFAIGASGQRRPLRVVGLDVLAAASLSPSLMPALAPGEDRLDLFAPAVVFLNAAARTLAGDAQALRVQTGLVMREARIAGSVAAGGPALAVMDIGAAQDFFGRAGELSRIDVRLAPGTDRSAFVRSLDLPAGVVATDPADAAQRV